jgi:hypothetical protein
VLRPGYGQPSPGQDAPPELPAYSSAVLVANRLATAIVGDHSRHTGWARSDIHRWFTDPASREVYPPEDHQRQARSMVASLRAAHGASGPHSRAGELVRVLRAKFRELWERHEVAQRFADHKVLLHPEAGPIEVDCQALFTEDQSQALLVLTPTPGGEAEDKVRLLAVLGHEKFAATADEQAFWRGVFRDVRPTPRGGVTGQVRHRPRCHLPGRSEYREVDYCYRRAGSRPRGDISG